MPLAVVTALAGLTVVLASASGGDASRSVPLAGSLDPSFGSGGVVIHGFGSGDVPAIGAIAVQPDGKIVLTGQVRVAGNSSTGTFHGWVVARYLRNGSPDPGFGDGGYVETTVKGGDVALAGPIALQPDGKIVVAGRREAGSCSPCGKVSSEFMLARYNPNGSLDTSSGTDGITTTVIPQPLPMLWDAYASAVVVLPKGEILIAGTATSRKADITNGSAKVIERESFALARYRRGGSLDPTFGDGGIVQTRFGGNLELAGIAVRPNGKIVVTGTASRRGLALAQYLPDGSLDPSFGHDGKVAISARLKNGGGPPTLQNGKIVVSGWPRVARFLADGRLDTTFGKRGFVTVRGEPPGGPAILAQRDGKILVTVNYGGGVGRLLPNGRFDPSFGKHGIVHLWPAHGAIASALALQSDGKILAGGLDPPTRRKPSRGWTLVRLIGGNNCVVPVLLGETVSKATVSLKRSFCRRGPVASRFSSTVASGRVIATTPARGTRLPGGAKVALVVSRGKH